MRILCIMLALVFWGCSIEPEPLIYGKDQCHSCKMTLMDKKFGAELVTTKGKVYKFDDINCLFNFYNEGSVNKEDFRLKLVVDFSRPEKLIDAEKAVYLKSGEIKSPMASQVAAFETTQTNLAAEWNATEYKWGELQNQFSQ
ncbi:MAG TPA: nitrous oxide reductase accessory protein NosL [Chryseolinea sp.]|nr:nitrous oxide reductase accessory protein NosL [Chryseolinea sp.]